VPDNDFYDGELASWLQEAGRRRRARPATPFASVRDDAAAGTPTAAKHTYLRHPRELFLFAVAALAFLPYFFADVQVQIACLPHVIVFV
jgi:hypothetical protein